MNNHRKVDIIILLRHGYAVDFLPNNKIQEVHFMKKILALFLALALCLGAVSALAESVNPADIEDTVTIVWEIK